MRILDYLIDLPHPFNKIGDGPEGPEVARVSDSLNNILIGRTLSSIIITEKGLKNHSSLRRIDFPSVITEITSKGKKILIYIKRNDGSKILIANALMMTGYWSFKTDNYVKFTFIFKESKPIHFCSIRGFSRTYVLHTENERKEFLNKIGPDILRETLSITEWIERMRKMTIKRKGSRPFLICDALIEQKIFSGIGNYIRADAMYISEIKPDRPVYSLSDEELERLYIAVCRVVTKSYKSKGYTIRDFKHVDGRPGHYIPLIYGQERDKFGNVIVKERFSESKHKNRTVHWVPNIQK